MTDEIRDLESLCDFINQNEDWQLETEEIIERNGWENLCGTTWGIARDGDYVAEFNDSAEAEVHYRPQNKE